MVLNPAAPVTTVTSDLFFLDDALAQVPESPPRVVDEVPFWESMRQKRADKSASNLAVKNLLQAATQKGMSQKDFEIAAGDLHANDSTIEKNGFNGTLWNYYVSCKARMSLLTFGEYAQHFFSKGWLSDQELKTVLEYSTQKIDSLTAVKKMFPPGASPDWQIERTVRTHRSKRA